METNKAGTKAKGMMTKQNPKQVRAANSAGEACVVVVADSDLRVCGGVKNQQTQSLRKTRKQKKKGKPWTTGQQESAVRRQLCVRTGALQ